MWRGPQEVRKHAVFDFAADWADPGCLIGGVVVLIANHISPARNLADTAEPALMVSQQAHWV
ncbi:hypothetical protein GCM10008938_50920 [Deinococcus roseus]|uniref:Uncharacterized protein n=1 Tax=Deinococcus roseus TaxID=392414 RepID=A0ABQ2DHU4_9DEIO|nr:hypothetical protein GCM10008938_50920 [Deinococcus roseus]